MQEIQDNIQRRTRIVQDTIKTVLVANTTTVSARRQVLGGTLKQVQAYNNNTDVSKFIEIAINDVSGNPIVRRQPIANLRSRDGNYFSNMPLNERGGTEVEIVIYTSASIATDTNFAVVFDIETTC